MSPSRSLSAYSLMRSMQRRDSWTEQAYPKLIHYNRLDKGGHFAAWEQPSAVLCGDARVQVASPVDLSRHGRVRDVRVLISRHIRNASPLNRPERNFYDRADPA